MELDYSDHADEFDNPFDSTIAPDEEEDMDGKKDHQVTYKDEIIFLIDCRNDMMQKKEEGDDEDNFYRTIQKAFLSFIKSKIVSAPNDKTCLVLYNTKTAQNNLSFPGVSIVFDMNNPTPERIKQAQEVLEEPFEERFGSADSEHLYQALWASNYVFKEQGLSDEVSRRIFLFTCDDHPYRLDEKSKSLARHHAEQLANLNVQIELFPIEISKKFCIENFFVDVVTFDPDDITKAVVNPTTRLADLTLRLRRKEFKKRAVGSTDLVMGSDFKIGAKFFSLISKAIKPPAMQLDSQNNNKLMQNLVKYTCEETGAELYPEQIGKYLPLGSEKVRFSDEEMKEIKKFDEPSLTLMGFKPSNRLKEYHNVRNSYFIYPDDERIEGSSQVFHSLIEEMLEMDKIAIVRFIPKRCSVVSFAAMVPQNEGYDEENNQTPPGFNLIFLPFADDLRDLQELKTNHQNFSETTPSREQILCAKRIINAMDFDFSSMQFENPDLQSFYSYLQSSALGDKPEKVNDYLMPDYDGLKKIEPLIANFKEKIYNNYEGLQERLQKDPKSGLGEKKNAKDMKLKDQPPGKKAAAGYYAKNNDSGNENQMEEEQIIEVAELDMQKKKFIETCIKEKNYRKVKVVDLHQYMAHYKLNTTGRLKDDCINAVNNLMKRNGLL